jgi:hypothetical protein
MTAGNFPPIYGLVKYSDGSPIPAATVSLAPESQVPPTLTDAQGRYQFASEPNDPGDFELGVSTSELPAVTHAMHPATLPVKVDFSLTLGAKPDMGAGDGLSLDLSKAFEPFGRQPHPGSTFYFSNEEIFAKSGAEMTVWMKFVTPAPPDGTSELPVLPEVVWEYWNGFRWVVLGIEAANSSGPSFTSLTEGTFTIRVRADFSPVEVNGQKARWMRARLLKGAYGFLRTFTFPETTPLEIVETVAPVVADMRLGYIYRSLWERPEHCLTYNDFHYEDHSQDIRWPGNLFPAFRPVTDVTPALYLGFDRPLPPDLVSLYVDVRENADQAQGPPLQWEYWDSSAWQTLSVRDETQNLALPGMVEALWPGVKPAPSAAVTQAREALVVLTDPREAARFRPGDVLYIVNVAGEGELTRLDGVSRDGLTLSTPLSRNYTAATIGIPTLPRFGVPRTWIRARLEEDGAPLESAVNGVHANAVWAEQLQSFENEVIGSSDHEPEQVFFVRHRPVLPGEMIEVRELEGARAAVELPILREELLRQGLTDADLRTVLDRRSGAIAEVWIRWRERPHLFFSTAEDRHYVIERSRGRVLFGDDRNGRIPPAGHDNIRIAAYRSGGGLSGNVPAGALSQLLSGVLAQTVTNPRGAEGGADVEAVAAVNRRGPQVIRHRGRSMSARDYEALALEASPAVAVARALPTTHPNGRPAAGWVTVIIVPHAVDARPQPSYGLRRRVRDFLALRAPAGIAGQIAVIGPTYLPVGVEAVLSPLRRSEAGIVVERAHRALSTFLHPLTGGPGSDGWPFGRDVYLSDVAAVLEALDGVDYVATINLLLGGTPRGERVNVASDRMVVAGPLVISLSESEP